MITTAEKESAKEFKDLSKSYKFFEDQEKYLKTMSELIISVNTFGQTKYYRYQPDGKISTKYIGESALFLAIFKVEKNKRLVDGVL